MESRGRSGGGARSPAARLHRMQGEWGQAQAAEAAHLVRSVTLKPERLQALHEAPGWDDVFAMPLSPVLPAPEKIIGGCPLVLPHDTHISDPLFYGVLIFQIGVGRFDDDLGRSEPDTPATPDSP